MLNVSVVFNIAVNGRNRLNRLTRTERGTGTGSNKNTHNTFNENYTTKNRMESTRTPGNFINLLLSKTIIVAICFGMGNSSLLTAPSDTAAVVGHTVIFNCSTSEIQNPKIQWHYDDKHVYAGGKFLFPYIDRFRIEIDISAGSYNLVIPNVTRGDAGRYQCLDDDGFGEKRSAELMVLDGNLVCSSDTMTEEIVGPNNCNIDPDVIQLSCSATYTGNIAPILKWTRFGDRSTIGTGRTICKNSTNRVDCNLTVKADHLQLDGSFYICHTELTMGINCTSSTIGMIYSFNDFRVTEKSINEELSCKVNTSSGTHCSNRWIWNAFNGSRTVGWDQSTVRANASGIYRCESKCNIGGKQCSVSAMLVYVPNDDRIEGPHIKPVSTEVTSSSDWTVIFAVVITVLVLLLVASFIGLLLCHKRWRKHKRKHSTKYELPLLPPTTVADQGSDRREANEHDYDEIDNGTLPQNGLQNQKLAELQQELTDVRASLENRTTENESLAGQLETSKKTTEELRDQNTELRKQKAELEERLISEAKDHKMKLDEANAKKAELQEKVKRLDEAEGKKAELQEKVKRLLKRNHELGVSLYLPPKDSFEYKFETPNVVKTRASEEPKNLGVCGVTILDKELFVISDQHPEVEVYDMWTFKHSRNIPLHGVHDPGDIAACNENRCIYIVDWTERNLENKLLRLDADGKEEIKRLPIKDDECRLFVTRESNVLVTFHRSRKIVEYARDWSVVFQTNFKDASIYPIHSVKLSNGLFAICHGTSKESTHRVCIVDDQGHLLKSFGGRRGAGVEQINFPTYLTVDRNDNILVTDRDNRRVLVLNSRLELTSELLAEKDQIRRPRALQLDETNGRLVVADCDEKFENGQVLIFNIK